MLDGDQIEPQSGYNKSVFETLIAAYSQYSVRICITLILGLIGRGLLLSNANVIGYWVDSFCTGPQCRALPYWLSAFSNEQFVSLLLALAILGLALTLFFRVSFSRLSAQAVSSIYDEVTLRTSRFPIRFFDETPAGRIVTRFSSDYGNVFRLFGGPLAEFISIVFDLILMVILITVASPIFLIFVAFIALLNFLVYRLHRDQIRTLRRQLSGSRSPSISHYAETAQGASTIRALRRENVFTSRFLRLDSDYQSQRIRTMKYLFHFSFQMNSLSAVFLLVTGVASYFLIQKGHLSIGSVGVAFSFIALSGNTIQMFFDWLAQFEEAMIGVERLDRYLRKDTEPGAYLPSSAKFKTQHPVYPATLEKYLAKRRLTEDRAAQIDIEDLWFRYRPDLPWVLKGVSLQVKPGERLGVIGRTGSGKSSLIQAIFHLYPIDKGQVRINGHKPKLNPDGGEGIDLQLFRQSIAFISQEPILFQGNLRLNLDPYQQHDDTKLIHALEQVDLKTWLETHPEGLSMKIEEKGKNLSLGERQLICMARCLLQETPIVIMDEATSAVDPQSEEILVRATEEFFADKTQIIIAHRLSTLSQCDRILWLQHGEVIALGPAREVLKKFEGATI